MNKDISYKAAGVDIDLANSTKQEMAKVMTPVDFRVLNRVGAFASLYDIHFPELVHPVLVMKTEEPGSKQLLALQYDRVESICQDMVNHLINDCIAMGATPLAVQDAIICGKLDKTVVLRMVRAMTEACHRQDCELIGGETSEQPGVLKNGTYVLTSSIIGVVDKDEIIDGNRVCEGDIVIGLESSGPHTNGYTLLRAMIDQNPDIVNKKISDGRPFLEGILTAHRCYYQDLKALFAQKVIHGMAHITGGGIRENLNRILPDHLDAIIDLSTYPVLPVFKFIKKQVNIDDNEMLRTFNMGIGYALIVDPEDTADVKSHFTSRQVNCFQIGKITQGNKEVRVTNRFDWSV